MMMTEMAANLRAATAADVDDVARVWHRGWHDGHVGHVPEALHAHRSLDSFRERVPARIAITTVATIDARIAGFIMVHDDEVEQIYVADDARGSGLAAALLEHGERTIAARFELAWLAVVGGNLRACRFYARHGWHDAGAIDYEAEIAGGIFTVAARRYEKRLVARFAGP
jgi:GNAT superfamily N-acetyltransferase